MLLFNKIYAQNPDILQYKRLIQRADSLLSLKQYFESAINYERAFRTWGGLGYREDKEKCSKAWISANLYDSSLVHLKSIIKFYEIDSKRYLTDDSCFSKLLKIKTKSILELEELIEQNNTIHNNDMTLKINDMVYQDQYMLRLKKRLMKKEVSIDSLKFFNESLWELKFDSLLTVHNQELKKIFKKVKYPSYKVVGKIGSQNYWLLVQHQDKDIKFQKKNLKSMKKLVEQNQANGINYAYLNDRVLTNSKKKQVFGTQMKLNKDSTSYEPLPLKYPKKTDELRIKMGLDSLNIYIEQMNKANEHIIKKKK